MIDDILQYGFLISLLSGMIRIATPLLLAALGELVVEKSGLLNLGIEGLIVIGAFAGFITTFQSGSLWLGALAGAVAAGVFALIFGLLTITLKADQTVSGLAINILSSGLTFYLYRVIFQDFGAASLPNVAIFPTYPIPLLSKIPLLGPVLFNQAPLTYFGLIMTFIIAWFLFKTKYGLVLRCIGDNPRAMDMRGIKIQAYQHAAVFFGGMMAGLGGAFLSIGSAGLFLPDISGGRGWIAVAIVIFGNWSPINILFASLFFGLLDTFQLQIQGLGVQIPYQLFLALPYVLTIVAICFGHRNYGSPVSLGIPYRRESK